MAATLAFVTISNNGKLCDKVLMQGSQTLHVETPGINCPTETVTAATENNGTLVPITQISSSSSVTASGSGIKSEEILQAPSSNAPPSSTASANPVTSTSPTISATPAIAPKNRLAGGAVAGVAIGMLIVGALIAGAIFLFLLRRQRRRYAASKGAYPPPPAPYTGRTRVPEKGATVTAVPGSSIDDLLPQPAEDDAITGDLSNIRDNIKNHVRTYYHSGHVSAVDINESGIREIAATTGSNAAVIVVALLNPSTRNTALRSLVGSVILTRCTGERNPSLLPDKLDELLSYISLNGSNKSQLVLFSKWKTITGALLQQRFGKPSQDPGRAQSFEDVVTSLDAVLAPFVKGSVDGGQRRRNLDMILTRAANFAFLLFAQPGSFHFDFISRQSDLVVFPALVQTVGDQGQPLSPVKVLTEQEAVMA